MHSPLILPNGPVPVPAEAHHQPTLQSPVVSGSGPPTAITQQVTLRTLVNDLIGGGSSSDPMASAGFPGVAITASCIRKAVTHSSRHINRQAILANLDLILAKEVDAGYFVQLGPDSFSVPPIQVPPPVIIQPQLPPQPMPPPPPRSTSSHHHVMNIGSTRGIIAPTNNTRQQFHVPTPMQPSLLKMPSQFQPMQVTNSKQQQQHQQHQQQQQQGMVVIQCKAKSEEEQKNDLINEKISKLQEKIRGGDKSSPGKSSSKAMVPSAKEPLYVTLREKRLATISRRNAEAAARRAAEAAAASAAAASFDPPSATSSTSGDSQAREEEEKNALAKPLLEAAAAKGRGRKLKGRGRKTKIKAAAAAAAAAATTTAAATSSTDALGIDKSSSSSVNSRKRKREEWLMKQQQQQTASGRPGSKREKVCACIWLCHRSNLTLVMMNISVIHAELTPVVGET